MLQKALQLNPNGIDPNYFYADYLFEQGRYRQSLEYLDKANRAPPRPGRELADKGRRAEIAALSAKVKQKLGSTVTGTVQPSACTTCSKSAASRRIHAHHGSRDGVRELQRRAGE